MIEGNNEISDILNLERPKYRGRKAVFLAVILLTVSGGLLWKFRSPGDAQDVSGFETEAVRKGRLKVVVSATGTLKPVNQVDVGTEVSGIIREVLVDFNDPVEKGQILAKLDASRLEAKKLQSKASREVARAEYAKAQSDVAEVKTNLERLQKTYQLSKGKVPAKQDIDTAETKFKVAQAQVKVARANIAKAEAELEADISELAKATIFSPIRGIVLNREVDTGQTVAASLQSPVLFTLAEDLTRMMLYVSVDEADVGQVKESQAAEFIVDAYPDKTFPAQITQVRFAPQAENGVVTYECLLEVDNSDLLLRPGMTATADIMVQDEQDALLVPNTALRFKPARPGSAVSDRGVSDAGRNGRSSIVSKLFPRPNRRQNSGRTGEGTAKKGPAKVWILQNGQPVSVAVKTGLSDGIHTRILKGDLKPGQQIIVGIMPEVE